MKLNFTTGLLSISMLFKVGLGYAQTKSTAPLLPLNNKTLWYTSPAKVWEEALPIGNGQFGAMIFGHPSNEKLQLNEITLWSGDPQPDADRKDAYQYLDTIRRTIRNQNYKLAEQLTRDHFTSPAPYNASYQTLGNLTMKFKLPEGKPVEGYRRWLNIDQAIAGISFSVNGIAYQREIFSSAADQAMVQRLSASKKGSLSLKLGLSRIENAKTRFVAPNTLIMTGHADGKLTYEVQLTVLNTGGSVKVSGQDLEVVNADELTIIMAAGTSYTLDYEKFFLGKDPHEAVTQRMERAIHKPYLALKKDHINEYQPYFRRVNFELGNNKDPGLPTNERLKAYGNGLADPSFATLFYQYGRYLLISSSRPGNLLPSNSQGLWGDGLDLPWKCDYKSNINYEMNYWPAEQSNLSEMHLPMIRLTQALVKPGTKTAKTYYGPQTPGWFYGYTTNGWAWTSPGADLPWGVFIGGSGWACQHLWEHYAFTRDKNYLKTIYPTLKGAAEFYMATLIKDKNGFLVTSPSTSPENYFVTNDRKSGTVTEGATMEKSIIWDLLNNVAQAALTLNDDQAFQLQVKKVRDGISPLKTGKAGQLQEWNEDWDLNSGDPHHRHVSHLFALHPGRQITALGTPELAKAARKTLELRGDDGTGWSIAWKENFWARLREGDHAHKLLSNQLRATYQTETIMADAGGTYPNLFDAHPPFQIDGNFGAVSGMTEMLLQSMETYTSANGQDAYILDLLPALPTAWPSGHITGLKARGGFEVSLKWKDGKLHSGTIKSLNGEPFKIRTSNQIKIKEVNAIARKADGNFMYSMQSKKGITYSFSSI
ncbi:alpha-L-fucosidase 2 [Pedobacter suwonensis]|uniref:Alpha-L-fucosidase 2 n=1 Tax=Pedobacter suwonensis TaxID=332999 RepID=A0A1I0SMT6_9SPHI|nr:glycoside hydrolase family 95 protein [Pedobacter suwonensis]SFA40809.1 alpha-L-fucosidase 2 [Pedobacter suwonensis]